jgi:hypothetical protein
MFQFDFDDCTGIIAMSKSHVSLGALLTEGQICRDRIMICCVPLKRAEGTPIHAIRSGCGPENKPRIHNETVSSGLVE